MVNGLQSPRTRGGAHHSATFGSVGIYRLGRGNIECREYAEELTMDVGSMLKR